MPVPTSDHLSAMLDQAPGTHVSVGWLLEQLGERSFGLTLFVMALIALMPGASMVIGVLIAWPAIAMILGHDAAVLPSRIARHEVGVDRLARLIGLVVPHLRRVERLVRPRWPMPFQATKRMTGIVMLLLGAMLISPVPFTQILPALVIMLLALAYLEEDGIALMVALIAALGALAATGATVWGTVEAIDWLDPAAASGR